MATTEIPANALTNPAAYGSVPVIPPTSTNSSTNTSSWNTSLPNYDALASVASMNIGNQLAGTLNPQDLANAQQWAAQRGVATGTGFGSPNNMAAYQQFLGLSSQQLEQQGQTNLNAGLAAAPRTTTSAGTQTTDNNVLAAEMAASPNPYAAAMANLAAQQAGLAGGAGAAGGGQSQVANRPLTPTTGIPPGVAVGGTGPFGGAAPTPYGATQQQQQQQQGAVTGNNIGGIPTSGASGAPQAGGVMDAQGNEWVSLGDGTYMNLTTGDIQQGAPGGNTVSGAIDYGNGQTGNLWDPFQGTAAQQPAYGSMPNYAQVGPDPMAGLAPTNNPFSGDVSDPNSAWWDQSGGTATTDPFSGDISDPSSSWWSD